jgi:hypothetical protein
LADFSPTAASGTAEEKELMMSLMGSGFGVKDITAK